MSSQLSFVFSFTFSHVYTRHDKLYPVARQSSKLKKEIQLAGNDGHYISDIPLCVRHVVPHDVHCGQTTQQKERGKKKSCFCSTTTTTTLDHIGEKKEKHVIWEWLQEPKKEKNWASSGNKNPSGGG
jgi:hypothetical protein